MHRETAYSDESLPYLSVLCCSHRGNHSVVMTLQMALVQDGLHKKIDTTHMK
jgi:hypothetical protein